VRIDEDLHERLRDLADSAGPWDDPLPAVLDRASAHRRMTPATRRRRWRPAPPGARKLLGVAAVVALVAGSGVGLWQLASGNWGSSNARSAAQPVQSVAPRAGAAPPQAAPSPCGPVPVSSGPAADTASVSVRLARSATGAVTGVRPQLHVPAAGQPVDATGSVRVVLLAGGRVVASGSSVLAGSGGSPTALRVAPLPTTSCSQRRLPPGRYTMVVALGYRTAGATAGLTPGVPPGVIVSRPVPVTVR